MSAQDDINASGCNDQKQTRFCLKIISHNLINDANFFIFIGVYPCLLVTARWANEINEVNKCESLFSL